MPEYVEGQAIVGYAKPGAANVTAAQKLALQTYLQSPNVRVIPRAQFEAEQAAKAAGGGMNMKYVLIAGAVVVVYYLLKKYKKI